VVPSPPKIDWDAAYSYFVALGPRRSYGKVSARFSVSATAVRKHALADQWISRAKKIDRQAASKVENALVRSRADRVASQIRVADSTRLRFEEQLAAGEKVRATDVASLARVEALFEGEATDRIELSTFKSAMDLHFDLVREMDSDPQKDFDWFLDEFERRFVFAGNGSSGG
jgi:hypothetical protein